MDFEDLSTALAPPPNRVGKADGAHEHHLYEGAVMVAYAMHLLRTEGARDVRIHPDGEHGKQFDFAGWLSRRGFSKTSSLGTTAYGGIYRNSEGQTITVDPLVRVSAMWWRKAEARSSRPSARAASSTPAIPDRYRGSTKGFVRR